MFTLVSFKPRVKSDNLYITIFILGKINKYIYLWRRRHNNLTFTNYLNIKLYLSIVNLSFFCFFLFFSGDQIQEHNRQKAFCYICKWKIDESSSSVGGPGYDSHNNTTTRQRTEAARFVQRVARLWSLCAVVCACTFQQSHFLHIKSFNKARKLIVCGIATHTRAHKTLHEHLFARILKEFRNIELYWNTYC